MMEAVRTSETSVNFNVTTRRYIPENSKLHSRRHENLKSHKQYVRQLTSTIARSAVCSVNGESAQFICT
jgi:hypothetical protein